MSTGKTIRVRDLASARSGDKGNHANIGVVANDEDAYGVLCSRLTAVRVQDYFKDLGVTRVERFELPKVLALNFLLYDALAGGASRSLRIDTQGKLLGTSLLDLTFRVNTWEDGARNDYTHHSPLTTHLLTTHSYSPMSVIVKKNLPSGTIILNRPEKRNALSRQMLEDLAQAFDDLHQERRVRGVILTGAGSVFCAGMDLAEMQETANQPDALMQWHDDAVQYRELIDKMLQFPKPIIAAVNGPAVAGGAGLLLASDLVVAAPEAKFGLPEPRRGIVAGMVAPLLVFRVGGSYAASLLLTGRMIEPAEAQRIGLYHEVVKSDLVWARSQEIASEIAHSAPEAIQLTKKLLNETIGEHLGTQLSAGAAASATARTTEAAREGLAAFLEKREPKWP